MTDYSNPSEVEWGEHLDRIAADQEEHGFVDDERPHDWTVCGCIAVGRYVQFRASDEELEALGKITRVWVHSPTVTIISDDRTFVRRIDAVRTSF